MPDDHQYRDPKRRATRPASSRSLRTIWAAGLMLLLTPLAVTAAELTVEIAGVKDARGYVLVGLYDTKKGFAGDDRMAGAYVRARAGRITVAFTGLKPGRYVIAAFHDADRDGKLGRNFLGIPREGLGFSNDATGFAGPPAFEKAAFSIPGKRRIIIRLNY